MSTATAIFIRFYNDAKVDQGKWQNFFVDKTIDGYVFRSFNSSDMLMNVSIVSTTLKRNYGTLSISRSRRLTVP